MPGGGGCPSFVPSQLLSTVAQNRQAVDVVVALTETLGGAVPVIGPTVLAPVGLALSALENGCDVASTFQAQCKLAAQSCTVASIACGVGATAATLSVAGIPGAPVFLGVGAVCAALAPIFGALGGGKAPKLGDVTNAAGALGTLTAAGISPADAKNIVQMLAPFIGQVAASSPTFKAHAAAASSSKKSDAVAAAKAKSAAKLKACTDSGGHYDASTGTCVNDARQAAVTAAKAKSAAALKACQDGGGRYDPTTGKCVPVVVPLVPSQVLPPVAAKGKASTPVGAIVGGVGGFFVGGPLGAAAGAALGGVVGHLIGAK
jgi:hypothetical protein